MIISNTCIFLHIIKDRIRICRKGFLWVGAWIWAKIFENFVLNLYFATFSSCSYAES